MGAGGTDGGIGQFIIGLAMIIGGGYLMLDSIRVHAGFGWGHSLYSVGGYGVTGGIVLIPLIFGIVLVFYRASNPLGWLLSGGSMLALIFGIIRNLRFSLDHMSAFELIVILVLLFGGVGLFAASLRDKSQRYA
ncbi:MAG: hypothetical protein AAF772_16090 [Acidobacteriota bacterium]